MRIAAIDIGTNSIHMVIARVEPETGLEVLDRERDVVQIGRGSFQGRRLRSDAVRRTLEALRRFVRLAHSHQVDRLLCTTTAAVREARNGGEFLTAAQEEIGVHPRVIPAGEEGRLAYLGVRSAIQLDDEPVVIVDIGGGSMQLSVGNLGELHQVVGVPLGALRLTETFLHKDPPTAAELEKLQRHIGEHLDLAVETVRSYKPKRVIGCSGSIHALADLICVEATGKPVEHVNGHTVSRKALSKVTAALTRMNYEKRKSLTGLDAKRAEIILPGALVLEGLLERLGAEDILLSDFSVREGLVLDYAARNAREISAFADIEDLELRSVLQLLARFQVDSTHAHHVAQLALSLYDGLRAEHGLPVRARALLHYAALLHDIGSVIGYDGHAEHSYYVIRNGNLRGLSAAEIEVVAQVARHHGKRKPKKSKGLESLAKAERATVRWLSAILRVAEGLDRSHYQLIRSLRVVPGRRSISLWVSAKRDAQLELWAGRRRLDLLEKLVGMPVRLKLERAVEPARRPRPRPAGGDRVSAARRDTPAAAPRARRSSR